MLHNSITFAGGKEFASLPGISWGKKKKARGVWKGFLSAQRGPRSGTSGKELIAAELLSVRARNEGGEQTSTGWKDFIWHGKKSKGLRAKDNASFRSVKVRCDWDQVGQKSSGYKTQG